MVTIFRRDNTDEWEERQDRSKQPATEQHVCDSHCAHYCPAPAQPVSAETFSSTLPEHKFDYLRKDSVAHQFAEAYAAQQNAALREELEHERANVEMLASKIAFDNQAAEAELAEARGRQPDGYAYRYPDGCIRFNDGKTINGNNPISAVPYYFEVPQRKLPSAEAQWLIWSHEHGLWWRANKCGYTPNVVEAGRYPLKVALGCCGLRSKHGTSDELISPSPELLAALQEGE